MNQTPQTYEEYERNELAKLEQYPQAVDEKIRAFANPAFGQPASAASLAAARDQIRAWRKMLDGFDAGAQYLAAAGRPQVQQRLATIRRELDEVVEIFGQTHATALQGEAKVAAIQRGANAHTTAIIQQATAARKATFEATNKAWSDNFNNLCPHCSFPLGSTLLRWCPRCLVLLRP